MSFPSLTRSVLGDVDSSRSQLGIGWSGLSADNTLWNLQYAANHYCVDCLADITLDLPNVGFTSNDAQPGHWLTINNMSVQWKITIRDSTLTSLVVIFPGKSAKFIANTSSPMLWTIDSGCASFRAGVDPSSNPDPIIGGLLFPPGSTEINMPITLADQSIGLANPYIVDPFGVFSFGADTITINVVGNYAASVNLNFIAFGGAQNELKVAQLMDNSFSLFNGPPICTDSEYNGAAITTPLVGVVWTLTDAASFNVTSVPVTIAVKLRVDSSTDVSLALTSNVCIRQIH